jgi:hypothetical protein
VFNSLGLGKCTSCGCPNWHIVPGTLFVEGTDSYLVLSITKKKNGAFFAIKWLAKKENSTYMTVTNANACGSKAHGFDFSKRNDEFVITLT